MTSVTRRYRGSLWVREVGEAVWGLITMRLRLINSQQIMAEVSEVYEADWLWVAKNLLVWVVLKTKRCVKIWVWLLRALKLMSLSLQRRNNAYTEVVFGSFKQYVNNTGFLRFFQSNLGEGKWLRVMKWDHPRATSHWGWVVGPLGLIDTLCTLCVGSVLAILLLGGLKQSSSPLWATTSPSVSQPRHLQKKQKWLLSGAGQRACPKSHILSRTFFTERSLYRKLCERGEG